MVICICFFIGTGYGNEKAETRAIYAMVEIPDIMTKLSIESVKIGLNDEPSVKVPFRGDNFLVNLWNMTYLGEGNPNSKLKIELIRSNNAVFPPIPCSLTLKNMDQTTCKIPTMPGDSMNLILKHNYKVSVKIEDVSMRIGSFYKVIVSIVAEVD